MEVQIKDQKFKTLAENEPADQVDEIWQMLEKTAPNYSGYRKKTSRQIPLVLLTRQ